MNWEQLQKANETIITTNIKGKDYAEVNQRIKVFRMLHPNGAIITDLISNENGVAIIKATVLSESGTVLGTGLAYEKEGSTFINKTSYIENCETSAVGRALGMLGIGIDTSVASKEEVENAMANQNINYHQLLANKLEELGIDIKEYAKEQKINANTSQTRIKELLDKLG